MFKNAQAEKDRQARSSTAEGFPSAVAFAEENNLTYQEAVAALREKGQINREDARVALSNERSAEIRRLSEHSMSASLGQLRDRIAERQENAGAARDRAALAGVIKAGDEQLRVLAENPQRAAQVARTIEFMGLQMAKRDPGNPDAKRMLDISAAAANRMQRDRAAVGFENDNIAEAATAQGREWIETRDDLDRHGLLEDSDPRKKIRPADVAQQHDGMIMRTNTLPGRDLEKIAMERLGKNPEDETAKSWIATAAAMGEAKNAHRAAAQIASPASHAKIGTPEEPQKTAIPAPAPPAQAEVPATAGEKPGKPGIFSYYRAKSRAAGRGAGIGD